jgi:hypothetical protein
MNGMENGLKDSQRNDDVDYVLPNTQLRKFANLVELYFSDKCRLFFDYSFGSAFRITNLCSNQKCRGSSKFLAM